MRKPSRQPFADAVDAAVHAYERSGRMLDAALGYAACGYPIFPLDVSSKKPIPRRDPDPTGEYPDGIPRSGGVYKATCDPLIIESWWMQHPHALIGLPMGAKSGVWCVDVDTSEDHADGVAGWGAIVAQHEAIVTREHRSATGGPHLIFKWDPEQPIGCSKGDLPAGISVKGQGGYVVVPPSIRKGRSYTVYLDFNPITAPAWLINLTTKQKKIIKKPKSKNAKVKQPRTPAPSISSRPDALRELEDACAELAAEEEGGRNDALNRHAFLLGQLVGAECLDEETAREHLAEAARDCGLEEGEIAATIASGMEAGKLQPRDEYGRGRKIIRLLKRPPQARINNMSLEAICARVRLEIESACQLATLWWRDA